MADVTCERREDLLVIRMARGKANALNHSMVEDLNAAVDGASEDGEIHGLVLATDCPRFFSAGFDAEEVFAYDRVTMTLFFSRFIDLYESLYLLPKPVVAGVAGHAYAGGAVLALSCDLRIFAAGGLGFALNEVNLGAVLPPGLILMVLRAFGAAVGREMLLTGNPMTPRRALELGFASEVVAAEQVLERALARCRELAAKPPAAIAAIKHAVRELCGSTAARGDRNCLGEFLDHWFSPEAVDRRQGLLASLAREKP